MREGSAYNFCPPVNEGDVFELEDERGDVVSLEFLGLVLHEGHSYGFFFPVSEDEPALSLPSPDEAFCCAASAAA